MGHEFTNTAQSAKRAIIVPGYSLNSDCTLHPLLTSRLDKAFSLYEARISIIATGKMPPL